MSVFVYVHECERDGGVYIFHRKQETRSHNRMPQVFYTVPDAWVAAWG